MRAFIALELSDDIRKELARCQAELKASGADVKWVDPKNIHLTLKFLGEIREDALNQIKEILEKSAENLTPFEISLFKLGTFPGLDRARVVWAGIDKGCSEVEKLADILSSELEKIGFLKDDRPFSAHLTVGRVKSGKNKEKLKEILLSLEPAPRICRINDVKLFKSILTSEGPVYKVLYEASFKESAG